MKLEEAIKRIEERKRLWEEYAEQIWKYAWESGDYPFDIVERLFGVREEIELTSDYFYDHECARCVARELQRVLDILKQVF